jgi:tetratricopeptide (TPR) repeat protein
MDRIAGSAQRGVLALLAPTLLAPTLLAPTLLALTLALSACGTSTVQMVVVRPAVLNTRAYGGTVTVGDWRPAFADYTEVAGQLRYEIASRMLDSVAGSVRLMDYGGGLVVTGQVDDYAMTLRELTRSEPCDRDDAPDGKAVEGVAAPQTRPIKATCTWHWYEWRARVAVQAKVATASGQVLVWRPMTAERAGKTYEAKGYAPAPPNGHSILQSLRQEIADRVAGLVAPRKERVSVTLFDCAEPAKAVCEAGVRALAGSRFDEAVQVFTEAIGRLEAAKISSGEVAKAHWNRAIVLQYARRFDEAWTDLQRCQQLDPSDIYARQLAELQRERTMHLQLLDQGVAPPQPPAQSAPAAPASPPAAPATAPGDAPPPAEPLAPKAG